MAKITIERPYEWYHQSYVNIYINDERVGEIGSGKTMDFDLSPEAYKIAVKKKLVGFSKSIMVDLSTNDNKTIRVSSYKYGWLIGPLFLLILFGIYNVTVSFMGLERFFLGEVLAFAVMIALFMFLYSKYYFYKIEEVEENEKNTES